MPDPDQITEAVNIADFARWMCDSQGFSIDDETGEEREAWMWRAEAVISEVLRRAEPYIEKREAKQEAEAGASPASLSPVLRLHFPRSESMLDEEALIEDPTADDVTVEVLVCDHCFHLAHPDGLDDYCDPDVYWPCPTAKAVGVLKGRAPVLDEEALEAAAKALTRWIWPSFRGPMARAAITAYLSALTKEGE